MKVGQKREARQDKDVSPVFKRKDWKTFIASINFKPFIFRLCKHSCLKNHKTKKCISKDFSSLKVTKCLQSTVKLQSYLINKVI